MKLIHLLLLMIGVMSPLVTIQQDKDISELAEHGKVMESYEQDK